MASVAEIGAGGPPAAGVEMEWAELPERVRPAVEGWLGVRGVWMGARSARSGATAARRR